MREFTFRESVVLVYHENVLGQGFAALPSDVSLSLSRLSMIDQSNLGKELFKCKGSNVCLDNCFFGFGSGSSSQCGLLWSIDSCFSVEDCVMTHAVSAVMLTESKAVFRNCLIETFDLGIGSKSSQVEIENVSFGCQTCVSVGDGSEVTMKKCFLVGYIKSQYIPLVDAYNSTMSIEDSVIRSEICGEEKHIVLMVNSKFIMRNCELITDDARSLILLQHGTNAILENNKFSFEKQEAKKLWLVGMDKTVVLEFCENIIQGLDEIVRKGIEVSDVAMPIDGIEPKSSGALKIQHIHEPEDDAPTDELCTHMDQLGLEGSKEKIKVGELLCQFCSKVGPAVGRSFYYCGCPQCKSVFYCSKFCQKQDRNLKS